MVMCPRLEAGLCLCSSFLGPLFPTRSVFLQPLTRNSAAQRPARFKWVSAGAELWSFAGTRAGIYWDPLQSCGCAAERGDLGLRAGPPGCREQPSWPWHVRGRCKPSAGMSR